MKPFSTDGEWGTLLPYSRGLRMHIPSWVALILALPLLVFAAAGIFAHSIVVQLLFGVPGLLFLALWGMTRRHSKKFGTVRINQNTKVAIFTERDGTETSVQLQRFLSIKIQKVIKLHTYSWMAVLCGESGHLILETDFSFQNSLIKRIAPIGNWLGIPIEVSTEEVNFLDWLSTPDFRTNPYPSRNACLTNHSSGTR
ncbi:hypothetical protein [Thiobacillus sedimenti]|uniref:DUF304 domain-containing protein n=1 Tax=Thiobacillus sedimenti TaxID=3110231 RepID=A0ABZ1CMN0_9PROT|nr:hypothetical protein [Thiobacillus sp. SCUT-2]WRS40459.1 hypothetical protein VA613_06175 [Thiobacillus sp. SCUT-2]